MGFVAAIINTLAGGGSLLTVPALVLLGLPGTVANGTNRIGLLFQSVSAALRFRKEGVPGWRESLPVLLPISLGAVVGAFFVSSLSDVVFERVFGLLMLFLLIPTLRSTSGKIDSGRPWSPGVSFAAFFAIGFYGAPSQAGVGIILLLALARSGHDLVQSNSIKVVVVAVLTALAVPVFVAKGPGSVDGGAGAGSRHGGRRERRRAARGARRRAADPPGVGRGGVPAGRPDAGTLRRLISRRCRRRPPRANLPAKGLEREARRVFPLPRSI